MFDEYYISVVDSDIERDGCEIDTLSMLLRVDTDLHTACDEVERYHNNHKKDRVYVYILDRDNMLRCVAVQGWNGTLHTSMNYGRHSHSGHRIPLLRGLKIILDRDEQQAALRNGAEEEEEEATSKAG